MNDNEANDSDMHNESVATELPLLDDGKQHLVEEESSKEENVTVEIVDATLSVKKYLHPPSQFSRHMHIISIGLYYFSYIMDIKLAYNYASNDDWRYFAYTLVCFTIPTILNQLFSYKLFCDYADKPNYGKPTLTSKLFHIFISGPVYRQWHCFKYGNEMIDMWRRLKKGVKGRQEDFERYNNYIDIAGKYVADVRDVNMLSLYYAFLRGGPQVAFQLYILLTFELGKKDTVVTFSHATRIAVIVKDIVMISKGMASYKQSLRKADDREFEWYSFLLQFVYRIMFILSRILTIVVFATVFHEITFGVLGFHVLLMYFWLNGDKTNVFGTNTAARFNFVFETLAKFTFAIIYIFCYITTVKGCTLIVQSSYWLLIFAENITLTVVWMFMNGRHLDTYEVTVISLIFTSLLIGILILLLFYQFYHPTRNAKKDEESKLEEVKDNEANEEKV